MRVLIILGWAWSLLGIHIVQATNLQSVLLSSDQVKQGDVLRLDMITDGLISQGTVYLGAKKATVFRKTFGDHQKYHYICYLGISKNMPPKQYKLRIRLIPERGLPVSQHLDLTVKSGGFKQEIITLSPKKKRLQNRTSTLKREIRLLSKAFKTITRRPLFTTPFIRPATGRVSSQFGKRRVYNGQTTWQHSGMDIANKTNTPVVAVNAGKVILVEPFVVHGKTIVIDHGLGIHSVYTHLNKILVPKGRWVRQGQKIGLMGSTGVATGPHVHWGMSIQNTRVNPDFWLQSPNFHH